MKITSDTLIDIEHNFKVSAGPGAGKTYWIVNHIRNILQNSTRLYSTRKIACITYANVGVESILKKLGTDSNRVEVSTIHSFLYRHILKPYCTFIPDSYGLNIEELDGHDDTEVNFKNVIDWLENHSRKNELKHPYTFKQLTIREENKNALINWLYSLAYVFDEDGNLIVTGDRDKAIYRQYDKKEKITRLSNKCLEILEASSDLMEYKKSYWSKGIIDHNDVLFFSYQLIEKYPFILEVLRAKFPYFFIDEFQDTNPIQTKIIKKIGEEETIIGVIGDKAQSIYGFQGTRVEQFINFTLPKMSEYVMEDNRRSTNKIIDVLNHIRDDIQQNKYRNVEGEMPLIIAGGYIEAYNKVKTYLNKDKFYTLTRKNELSNALREGVPELKLKDNIINNFLKVDSSQKRKRIILACCQAVELARFGHFSEAIKKLKILGKNIGYKNKQTKYIINYLYLLLNNYDLYKDGTLMDFYNLIKQEVDANISVFRKSYAKDFYNSTTYREFAINVKKEEYKSSHKTIHKTKGDEFNNVMLVLKNEKDLDFLLKPDLEKNEEHRIYYVAVSRAVNRLFINVPFLSESKGKKLKNFFDIERL